MSSGFMDIFCNTSGIGAVDKVCSMASQVQFTERYWRIGHGGTKTWLGVKPYKISAGQVG